MPSLKSIATQKRGWVLIETFYFQTAALLIKSVSAWVSCWHGIRVWRPSILWGGNVILTELCLRTCFEISTLELQFLFLVEELAPFYF